MESSPTMKRVHRKAPSGRGLLRERVGEHARLRRLCKVGKFIRLSHPKFGGRYPKQNLTSKLRVLPLPPDGATPLPERGLHPPPVDKIKFLTNYVRTN